jgi:hypothetical protein
MTNTLPDFEYVSSVLHYDSDTGILTWKRRPEEHFKSKGVCSSQNTQHFGKEAGCARRSNRTVYRTVKIDGRQYQAHRLAYLLYTGAQPEGAIDHIDGNGLNNRASNLRDVTCGENTRNARRRRDNTSGVNGVVWRKDLQKWRAVIRVEGRYQHLGHFDTIEEAAAARAAANELYGYTERHGLEVNPVSV